MDGWWTKREAETKEPGHLGDQGEEAKRVSEASCARTVGHMCPLIEEPPVDSGERRFDAGGPGGFAVRCC